jgi:hypothetical protein
MRHVFAGRHAVRFCAVGALGILTMGAGAVRAQTGLRVPRPPTIQKLHVPSPLEMMRQRYDSVLRARVWSFRPDSQGRSGVPTCAMRVFVPDTARLERMPTGRVDTTRVSRMPVAPPGCLPVTVR